MAAPLIPWEPCAFPTEIQDELNRRKTVRNFHYVNNTDGWGDDGDWKKYLGPMTAWTRVCSNGYGFDNGFENSGVPMPGFVFFGGKHFYDVYGFRSNGRNGNETLLGWTPTENPHTLQYENSSNFPIHVPSPEISKLSVSIQKELYRRVTIDWVCFSHKQLEYMTPYFLVPGISVIVEWGWNHFNPVSLLSLRDMDKLKKQFNNPYPIYKDNILYSKGNYDVLFGIVTNFEWAVDGNKFKCRTEITSKDRIYAGLSTTTGANINNSDDEDEETPLDTIRDFSEKYMMQLKTLVTADPALQSSTGDDDSNVTMPEEINNIMRYIEDKIGKQKAKEYRYGIFYGRDKTIPWLSGKTTTPFGEYRHKKDFDRTEDKDRLWINMGLLVEILNYFSSDLKLTDNQEAFRVDVDDCVINGHPNLISNNSAVMLIPNAIAPKFFYGDHARAKIKPKEEEQYDQLKYSGEGGYSKSTPERKKDNAADYTLAKLTMAQGLQRQAIRDDIDELINMVRYSFVSKKRSYAFPFYADELISVDTGKLENDEIIYPARYSGYFKHLYFSVPRLQEIIKDESNKTFVDLYTTIFSDLTKSAANFWKFKLVRGTGKAGDDDKVASMKIIDENFTMYSANRIPVYSFDYYDADSLLKSIAFRPTLSNAQAIRTIYASTNTENKRVNLTTEQAILDYKFEDRLFKDDKQKYNSASVVRKTLAFSEAMRALQDFDPGAAPQITTKNGDKLHFRRLAIPATDTKLLNALLDDKDVENNPRYTGIMPGIQAEFTLQGIGGLRTFMMFLVRNLPAPYSHKNVIFRVINLQENIEGGYWTTTITAGVIPLRNHIRKRLGMKLVNEDEDTGGFKSSTF